jgi:hypothetical protein
MTMTTRYRGRTSLALSLFAALALAIPVHSARAATATIVPIGTRTLGLTYGQWGAKWWQYVYSIPVPTNPLVDPTGANCGVGQSGPVFFLVGVAMISGTETRNCTVPANKMLFFPILNFENDNLCPPNNPALGVAQLQAGAKAFMDGATALEADIDGVPVDNPSSYRAASPGGFSMTFPDNNMFQSFGCDGVTIQSDGSVYPNIAAGTYGPLVSDGYWLMLNPLPAGQHTIHFHGILPAFNNFTLDITYKLTVLSS